ncbi:hypothetical protein C8R41DRAFT_903193 [Lentinula lateritia]|uniref:Uncharacterized protein n=1 Tax=Lentinula lateritia TaxID=40482 RepID=A0ABQ8VDZ3_9AGAR|nr:hypothetical protein C8R41DRAFT_903193 [Lentinula lateritia]
MAHDGELGTERTFFAVGLTQVTSLFAAQHWVSCLPVISLTTITQFIHQMFNGPRMDPYVLRLLASLSAGFDRASHAEIPQVFNIGSIESFSRIHAKQIHSCKIGVEVVALISLARAKLVARASTFVVGRYAMLRYNDPGFSFYLLVESYVEPGVKPLFTAGNYNCLHTYYINDGIWGIVLSIWFLSRPFFGAGSGGLFYSNDLPKN